MDSIPYMKYIYTYDGSGNLDLYQSFNWDTLDGSWIMLDKYDYNFDASGNRIQQMHLTWDTENTVTVRLPRFTLSSATADEVLRGANRLLIGDEVIGFVNATLQTAETGYEDWYEYELDTLLRGLRDTRDEIDGHASNEKVVLLNEPGVYFIRTNIRQKNQTRKYKAVPSYEDESNVSDVATITHKAGSAMCFSPSNVQGSRSGYDVVCTWLRRTRLISSSIS